LNAQTYQLKQIIIGGRRNFCGMEERTIVAHGCRKTKKLRFGMEGTTVVAHGRLPSSSLPFILPSFFCM